jgi:hypothetical protein
MIATPLLLFRSSAIHFRLLTLFPRRNAPVIREVTHDSERYVNVENSAANKCGDKYGDNEACRLSVSWLVIRHCCA